MMASRQKASAGALGGSANERAAEFRARVGASLACAVIRDDPLTVTGLQVGAPHRATLISAEGDEPVDDLIVALDDGRRVFLQVKLKAGLTNDPRTPLGKALAQFTTAVRRGLGSDDQLVLASAGITRDLRELAAVLARERLSDPGGRTPREQAAIDGFREAAQRHGTTDAEFTEICRRLTIWETNPTTGDAAAALIARLDGSIVAVGSGEAGARGLADVIRELARSRGGLDGVGLVRALAVREVPLADDGGTTSVVAMAGALEQHESRMATVGSTLRLIGVPGELGELPFERADADIEVKVADEERASERLLEHAFRRRGRVLLEGNPGGGKSTALRTLAALAAGRDDWPVPLRVHLERLAKASGSLTRSAIAAATAELPQPEATALASALDRELGAGNVLLLLDGLDEVRTGRPALVERLVDWFGTLHPGVEIVVATRPSAISDAAALGLPVLSLQPPRDPAALVDAILEAVQPTSADDAWIDVRRAWLNAAFERDPQLRSTPLSVVVLTLIAARSSDPSALPTARALLLKRALEDIVGGWELEYRQRGAANVGPLNGSRAEEALMMALRVLGCRVVFAGAPTSDGAVAEVIARLRDEFALRPGDARAAARDAIGFWREAGLISFDAEMLRLTLRPFGELAAAWDVALRKEPDRRAWVAEARSQEDFWETLALAGSLTHDIADEWAAAVERDGHAAELAALASALRDGMQLSQPAIDAVAIRAGERLLADTASLEETARTLVRMPLTQDAKRHLRPLLSARARPARAVLLEALVTAQWNETGAGADERLRACIVEGQEEPPEPPPPEPNVLVIPERDSLYDEAYEAAAVRLAARSRADAELVVSAFDDGRFDFIQALRATLRKAGHRDLADSLGEKVSIGGAFAAWKDEDFEGAERRLMSWAARLSAPRDLDHRQRRRLDELADLFETAALNWVRPSWTEKHAGLAQDWIRIAAALGGFDLGVIAAQARIVLDEMDRGRGTETLAYDNGSEMKLDRWDRVDDPDTSLRRLVEMLGVSSHQVMQRVGRAIARAPGSLGAIALLEERAKILINWSRWYVVRLIVLLAPDATTRAETLAADDDPILRSIGAWYLAYRYLETSGKAGNEVFALVEDPDENVREAIIDGFALLDHKLDERASATARALRSASRQPWICRHCGAANSPQPQTGCVSCSTSGPEVARAVDDLLGDRESRPYRFVSQRRSPRRH